MNRSENDIFERINWENGMDIDANDLIMTENFFLNSMYKMKQTSLPAFGYGLLPDKTLIHRIRGQIWRFIIQLQIRWKSV